MSENGAGAVDVAAVAERYHRLSADFAQTVEAVPPDRWSSPSPCEDWTAREVVGHVVQTQGMFLGFVGDEVPADAPTVEDDPAGAFQAARAAVEARLADPDRAVEEFDGGLGRSTFAASVDRFLCFDLNVHRWDLAQAAGIDVRLDPQEVARVRADAEALGENLRGPGAFGPELEAPVGADEQARLLAFLGRRAD